MGPLVPYRVLEVSSGPAVGFAGLLLRFLGAEVAVLEDPDEAGDPLRAMPPLKPDGRSALFEYLRAGKGVVRASGQPLEELLGGFEVILHDDWNGPLRGVGAGLVAELPVPLEGRVVVSCSPYGAVGPKASWQASELTLFQAGGEGFLMPHGLPFEEDPDGPPIGVGRYVAHYQGGIAAAMLAVSALRLSREVGESIDVDVSIQDVEVSLNNFTISRYVDGVRESRATRAFSYGGLLPCRDGHVEILPLEQHQWEGVRQMLGDPEWARSEEMQNPVLRGKFGDLINEHLRAWTEERPVEEVVRLATQHGIPCGPYLPLEDLPALEQLKHRNYFMSTSDGHGDGKFPGPAWILNRWPKPDFAAQRATEGVGDASS